MKTQTGQRNTASQRATSLVEVLVVLVILLIGVFAVIRVFPLGFTFLRGAENRTLATSLAHNQTEQIKQDASNLPFSVTYSYFIANGSGGYVRKFIVDEDPDDLAVLLGNPYYSDINKFRFVSGEPVKIGLPTPNAFGSGFVYMIKLGPIYMDATVGNPANAPTNATEEAYYNQFLNVTSAPLAGTWRDSNNGAANPFFFQALLRSPQNYVIDYGDNGGGAYILFARSSQPRTFKVHYLKLTDDHDDAAGSNSVSVTDIITVPANSFGWIPLPSVTGNDSVDTGSETVTRQFTRLPAAASWNTDDPYQYKLISPNIDGTTSVANLGLLAFNPAGAAYSESGPGSQEPFRAYVDYAVLDWHIIRDDREVPSVNVGAAGEVPIRTSLQRLKSLNYVNPDNTLYEGLYPVADTNPTANKDIQVVRLDTGEELAMGDYELRGTTDSGKDFWMNLDEKNGSYATGTVYINTNRIPKGTPLRILYKAEGEWAVGLSKAAAVYRQVGTQPVWEDNPAAGVQYGDPAVCWGVTSSNRAQVYFAGTELNKSVVAVFEYTQGGRRVRTQPVQFSIDTAVTASNAAGDRRTPYAYGDVTRYMPGWDGNASTWRIVGDIKGVSIKTRVIWKDGLERDAPWRIQDLDTYQTQGQLQ